MISGSMSNLVIVTSEMYDVELNRTYSAVAARFLRGRGSWLPANGINKSTRSSSLPRSPHSRDRLLALLSTIGLSKVLDGCAGFLVVILWIAAAGLRPHATIQLQRF